MGRRDVIPVIVIAGPTASGKTALSIALSEMIDIEIISADSRQIYKYLDIGTAKPSIEELSKVKHHFIDILEPDEYFSAGIFGNNAYLTVKDIFNSGKIPVVVGGSGMYIQALIEGFFEEANINSDEKQIIKSKLILKLQDKGKEFLFDELQTLDSKAAEKYSDKNPRRILRALEYIYFTGNKFSSTFNENTFRDIKTLYFALNNERSVIYERINQRTIQMWDDGLLEETQKVLEMGYDKNLNSLNTVGYKECISLLEGQIDQPRAIELIQQNTRRYAKRQLTWIRKIDDKIWLDTQNSLVENAKIIADLYDKIQKNL